MGGGVISYVSKGGMHQILISYGGERGGVKNRANLSDIIIEWCTNFAIYWIL